MAPVLRLRTVITGDRKTNCIFWRQIGAAVENNQPKTGLYITWHSEARIAEVVADPMCHSCPALHQQTGDCACSSGDIESASHTCNCYHGKYIFPLAPLPDTLKPWKMPQKISHTPLCSFHLFKLLSALLCRVFIRAIRTKGISLLLISIADIITAEGLLGSFISEQ